MKPLSCAILIANLLCGAMAAPQLEKIFGKDFFKELRQERQLQEDDPQAVVVSQGIPDIQDFLLSDAVATFTNNLVEKTLTTEDNRLKNVVISPFSIHLCLSMLYYASPRNSSTHKQMSAALGLTDVGLQSSQYLLNYAEALQYYSRVSQSQNATVRLANKIFIKEGSTIKPKYQQVMQFYSTSVDEVSFANPSTAENSINRWVSDRTNGLIDELLSPGSVDPLTLMVLVNAIYYKANWLVPFDKRRTIPWDFNLLGSNIDQLRTAVHKEMMIHESVDLRAAYNIPGLDGASVLEIPYENTDFNMYVGLPKENTLEALNKLAVNFQYGKFAGSLSGGQKPVSMPKFEMNFEVGLKSILRSMGMTDMFDFGRANFTDMTDEKEIAVTSVAHSAVVKVDESGSEAAAATAAILGTRTVQLNRNDFQVDRPFVFMIHDKKHDVPLFFGRILNPSSEGDFDYSEPAEDVQDEDYQQEREEVKFASLEKEQTTQNVIAEKECLEESGYESVGVPNVAFPCPGRDTFPIETHNQEDEKVRQQQVADLFAAKGAKGAFQ